MDIDESEKEKIEDEKEKGEKSEKEESMDIDGEGAEKLLPKKREPEPTSFRVKNPARITKAQSKVCAFDLEQRYRPIRPNEVPFGVVILTDSTPAEEDEDLGAVQAPSLEGECAPPKPFEWTPPPADETVETEATEEKDTKA
mmetsp:Transcript_27232/g.40207  ORF Transcript_27232/g.40207 Transcript_27232/m.40207 type:complete len:142 (-) Transcript_27232:108-533(-)